MRGNTRSSVIGAMALFAAALDPLTAACTSPVIMYNVAGTFGFPISGGDKLKLEDEPFSISVVACSTLAPKATGPNYSVYSPIEFFGTVRSSLTGAPYTILPTATTLRLVTDQNGEDFLQIQGPVQVLDATIYINGSVAFPAGTLPSTAIATFPQTMNVIANSAFRYAQDTESTVLPIFGSASASIYTPPPAGQAQLYGNGMQVVATREDGTVLLQFYASGVRNRSQVRVQVAGQDVPVHYTGAADSFPGLDAVTIELPRSLAGTGDRDVVLIVDGRAATPVRAHIQ